MGNNVLAEERRAYTNLSKHAGLKSTVAEIRGHLEQENLCNQGRHFPLNSQPMFHYFH
jgi:hypothetical protein